MDSLSLLPDPGIELGSPALQVGSSLTELSGKPKVMSSSLATPCTVTHQAPLSMRFPRQGYWSGLPFPSPGDLPHLGIEPGSPALHVGSLPAELPGKPDICTNPLNYLLIAKDLSTPSKSYLKSAKDKAWDKVLKRDS